MNFAREGLAFILIAALIAAAAYAPQPAHLIKDFTPVAGVATVPHILVVPASSSATTVPALIAMLKAAPGKYNFASQGAGTLSHLESELFKIKTGADVLSLLFELREQSGSTLVLVTHDTTLAARADRVVRLEAGRIVHEATA